MGDRWSFGFSIGFSVDNFYKLNSFSIHYRNMQPRKTLPHVLDVGDKAPAGFHVSAGQAMNHGALVTVRKY